MAVTHFFIYDGLRPDVADPAEAWKAPWLEENIASFPAFLSGFQLFSDDGANIQPVSGQSSSSSSFSSDVVTGFAVRFPLEIIDAKLSAMDSFMMVPHVASRIIVDLEIPSGDQQTEKAYVYLRAMTSGATRIASGDWKEFFAKTSGGDEANVATMEILSGNGEPAFFSICPKTDCPHVEEEYDFPEEKLNVKLPCEVCANRGENWICLTCLEVFCSRYVKGHMAQHNQEQGHPIAVSFSDLSVWCYACDSYIASKNIRPVLMQLHQSKFGHK